MEKFMLIMGSLCWWIPWAIVATVAMNLDMYGVVLVGVFAVIVIVRQLNKIIDLLKEQNELLRQRNEKQE